MINLEKKICIVGTGGLGREVLCYIMDEIGSVGKCIEDVVCFMVSDDHYREEKILGIDIIPQSKFDPSLYNVVVAIGDPAVRKIFVESLPENTSFINIIHPSVTTLKWVELGVGCIIMAGTIISCNIKIGDHAHLNVNTTIGHDCDLGDFFTTAPAVNISGSCKFGDCVYFGTNAASRQGIHICDNVVIGMGGVVVKDVLEEGVYIGNPVRRMKKEKRFMYSRPVK